MVNHEVTYCHVRALLQRRTNIVLCAYNLEGDLFFFNMRQIIMKNQQ